MPLRHMSSSPSQLERRIGLGLGLAGVGLVLVFILKLLLPWLLLAGIGLAGLWIWHRQQMFERSLYILFYDLIDANQGCISVLDFAKAAKLPGSQARNFLDTRAKEFYAGFEPTDFGDVIYTFRSGGVSPPSSPVADDGLSSPHLHQQTIPIQAVELTALSADQLACRLGCSPALLNHLRASAQFSYWTATQDPDHWEWIYDPLTASYRRQC